HWRMADGGPSGVAAGLPRPARIAQCPAAVHAAVAASGADFSGLGVEWRAAALFWCTGVERAACRSGRPERGSEPGLARAGRLAPAADPGPDVPAGGEPAGGDLCRLAGTAELFQLSAPRAAAGPWQGWSGPAERSTAAERRPGYL